MKDGDVVYQGTPTSLFADNDILEKCELDCPSSFELAKKLKEKGMILDLSKIKNVETLAKEIARVKKAGANNE